MNTFVMKSTRLTLLVYLCPCTDFNNLLDREKKTTNKQKGKQKCLDTLNAKIYIYV